MSVARHTVVLTDQVFPDVALERRILAGIGADLVVAGDRDEALSLARDADALLNTYLPLDADALGGMDRCRVIARYGIGTDNIDLDAARQQGIAVTNVPDYCVEEVAIHAVAMALALQRRLPQGQVSLLDGGWGVDALRPIHRLSAQVAGVVGLGRIGRQVAGHLAALGMTVLGHDPYVADLDGVQLVGLEELLSTADVVTLHSPLTPTTRGMVAGPQLKAMKPTAVLVNVSRGPLVVLEDLVAALHDGVIAGAGLDVFDHEPPDPERLRDVPNLLATPHSAFYSEEALEESQRKAVGEVVAALTGQPLRYQVNA